MDLVDKADENVQVDALMGLNSTPTIVHDVTSASDTTMYEIKFYNSKIPLKVSGDFNLAFMAQNPVNKFFRSKTQIIEIDM